MSLPWEDSSRITILMGCHGNGNGMGGNVIVWWHVIARGFDKRLEVSKRGTIRELWYDVGTFEKKVRNVFNS